MLASLTWRHGGVGTVTLIMASETSTPVTGGGELPDLDSRLASPRPRPRPRLWGSKTKTETETRGFQDQDQDQDSEVPRPRPRPRLVKTGLETSRDQDSSLENSKSATKHHRTMLPSTVATPYWPQSESCLSDSLSSQVSFQICRWCFHAECAAAVGQWV